MVSFCNSWTIFLPAGYLIHKMGGDISPIFISIIDLYMFACILIVCIMDEAPYLALLDRDCDGLVAGLRSPANVEINFTGLEIPPAKSDSHGLETLAIVFPCA